MLEQSNVAHDVRDIMNLLAAHAVQEVYKRFGPILEDMLGIQGEEEWLDFMEQQGRALEEHPLYLHLAAHYKQCLKLDGYEGDATEKLSSFLRQSLPEALYDKLDQTPVVLDLDEPSGMLEIQLEPYRKQLEALGYELTAYFDDTYCAGVYFVFLNTQKPQ